MRVAFQGWFYNKSLHGEARTVDDLNDLVDAGHIYACPEAATCNVVDANGTFLRFDNFAGVPEVTAVVTSTTTTDNSTTSAGTTSSTARRSLQRRQPPQTDARLKSSARAAQAQHAGRAVRLAFASGTASLDQMAPTTTQALAWGGQLGGRRLSGGIVRRHATAGLGARGSLPLLGAIASMVMHPMANNRLGPLRVHQRNGVYEQALRDIYHPNASAPTTMTSADSLSSHARSVLEAVMDPSASREVHPMAAAHATARAMEGACELALARTYDDSDSSWSLFKVLDSSEHGEALLAAAEAQAGIDEGVSNGTLVHSARYLRLSTPDSEARSPVAMQLPRDCYTAASHRVGLGLSPGVVLHVLAATSRHHRRLQAQQFTLGVDIDMARPDDSNPDAIATAEKGRLVIPAAGALIQCADFHTGPLCGACVDGAFMNAARRCEQCTSETSLLQVLILGGGGVMVAGLVGFITHDCGSSAPYQTWTIAFARQIYNFVFISAVVGTLEISTLAKTALLCWDPTDTQTSGDSLLQTFCAALLDDPIATSTTASTETNTSIADAAATATLASVEDRILANRTGLRDSLWLDAVNLPGSITSQALGFLSQQFSCALNMRYSFGAQIWFITPFAMFFGLLAFSLIWQGIHATVHAIAVLLCGRGARADGRPGCADRIAPERIEVALNGKGICAREAERILRTSNPEMDTKAPCGCVRGGMPKFCPTDLPQGRVMAAFLAAWYVVFTPVAVHTIAIGIVSPLVDNVVYLSNDYSVEVFSEGLLTGVFLLILLLGAVLGGLVLIAFPMYVRRKLQANSTELMDEGFSRTWRFFYDGYRLGLQHSGMDQRLITSTVAVAAEMVSRLEVEDLQGAGLDTPPSLPDDTVCCECRCWARPGRCTWLKNSCCGCMCQMCLAEQESGIWRLIRSTCTISCIANTVFCCCNCFRDCGMLWQKILAVGRKNVDASPQLAARREQLARYNRVRKSGLAMVDRLEAREQFSRDGAQAVAWAMARLEDTPRAGGLVGSAQLHVEAAERLPFPNDIRADIEPAIPAGQALLDNDAARLRRELAGGTPARRSLAVAASAGGAAAAGAAGAIFAPAAAAASVTASSAGTSIAEAEASDALRVLRHFSSDDRLAALKGAIQILESDLTADPSFNPETLPKLRGAPRLAEAELVASATSAKVHAESDPLFSGPTPSGPVPTSGVTGNTLAGVKMLQLHQLREMFEATLREDSGRARTMDQYRRAMDRFVASRAKEVSKGLQTGSVGTELPSTETVDEIAIKLPNSRLRTKRTYTEFVELQAQRSYATWELNLLVRRVVFILFEQLARSAADVRAFVIGIVTLFFLIQQVRSMPFETSDLNTSEMIMLMAALVRQLAVLTTLMVAVLEDQAALTGESVVTLFGFKAETAIAGLTVVTAILSALNMLVLFGFFTLHALAVLVPIVWPPFWSVQLGKLGPQAAADAGEPLDDDTVLQHQRPPLDFMDVIFNRTLPEPCYPLCCCCVMCFKTRRGRGRVTELGRAIEPEHVEQPPLRVRTAMLLRYLNPVVKTDTDARHRDDALTMRRQMRKLLAHMFRPEEPREDAITALFQDLDTELLLPPEATERREEAQRLLRYLLRASGFAIDPSVTALITDSAGGEGSVSADDELPVARALQDELAAILVKRYNERYSQVLARERFVRTINSSIRAANMRLQRNLEQLLRETDAVGAWAKAIGADVLAVAAQASSGGQDSILAMDVARRRLRPLRNALKHCAELVTRAIAEATVAPVDNSEFNAFAKEQHKRFKAKAKLAKNGFESRLRERALRQATEEFNVAIPASVLSEAAAAAAVAEAREPGEAGTLGIASPSAGRSSRRLGTEKDTRQSFRDSARGGYGSRVPAGSTAYAPGGSLGPLPGDGNDLDEDIAVFGADDEDDADNVLTRARAAEAAARSHEPASVDDISTFLGSMREKYVPQSVRLAAEAEAAAKEDQDEEEEDTGWLSTQDIRM